MYNCDWTSLLVIFSLYINILFLQVAEKTAFLRPIELKLVPVALEGGAFRSKFLDTDELMSYCSWFAVRNSWCLLKYKLNN